MSLREPKDELSDAVEAAQDKAVGQETIRYRKKGRGGGPRPERFEAVKRRPALKESPELAK